MLGVGDKSAPFCYGKFTLSKKEQNCCKLYKRFAHENLKYKFFQNLELFATR